MKRRFIAGVVCPACKNIDSTVVEGDGETQRRTCVKCGFSETSDVRDAAAVPSLTTRVTALVPEAEKKDKSRIPAVNVNVTRATNSRDTSGE